MVAGERRHTSAAPHSCRRPAAVATTLNSAACLCRRYQYRLCPAEEPLTEECFMKMPLQFDRTKQQLRWNNGTRLSIPGAWVDKGTNPIGSTWAKNPM
jgi:hypothetical protein